MRQLKTISGKAKNEIERYIDFISSFEEVRKIYLFGSYAYGTPNEESDIDLLVTTRDDVNRLEMAGMIRKGLKGRMLPLDVIVDWESEFETDSEKVTLQREVKAKGILLYDK
jgi:predicted nucleotidyltransferase